MTYHGECSTHLRLFLKILIFCLIFVLNLLFQFSSYSPELIAKYLESNPDETPTKKKKVRISLEPTREVPKRAAVGKLLTESDDEDGNNVAPKKRKKSAKKGKKSPAKGKKKAASVEYEVDEIVDDRMDGTKILYRIRWKGFKAADDTWEPLSKLSCPEKIHAYKASKAAADPTDYEVEKIMGEMFKNGERFFYVKWKGYPEEDNSWQSEEEVSCYDLIAKFRELCRSGEKKRTATEAKISTPKKSPVAAKKAKLTTVKTKAAMKMSPKKAKATTKSPKKSKRTVVVESDDDNIEMPEYEGNDGNEEGELITGDDLEYEVEKIVKERNADGHKEYLIRWKGCSSKEDTWEHENNMTCPNILNAFLKKKKK